MIRAYVESVKPKPVLSGAEGKEVTLDVDAHLVETAKANARYCVDGYKAFQPMEVE